MNNQLILWAIFILPYFTLFFMKKEDIKRFMPVGLLVAVMSVLIEETLQTLGIVALQETAYPLRSNTHMFGLNVVLTMWIFKFTYKIFWLYLGTEVILNLGFAFLYFGYFLKMRGIQVPLSGSPGPGLYVIITTIHSIILYRYQMWQEGIFAEPYKKSK
jgi:hypothetical protein